MVNNDTNRETRREDWGKKMGMVNGHEKWKVL